MHPDLDQGADLVERLRAAGCVFAEDEATLLREATTDAGELDALVARRVAGEPLEYVLGWAGFDGLRLAVGPGVFVPRRRTEFLVEVADEIVAESDDPVVVDLCCGCGALAAALLHRRARAGRTTSTVVAVDDDPAAVSCAERNLPASATCAVGDLFDAVPGELRGRLDVVLANVPYVPTDLIAMMPPEARDHERRATLDGGADGLVVLRRVLAALPAWLAPGGVLLSELGDDQVDTAVRSAESAGLTAEIRRQSDVDDEADGSVLVVRRRDG